MIIPVTFFVAIAFAVFSYSQLQGGPVAGTVFFTVLFIGTFIHYTQPLIEKLKPQLPEKLRR